MMNAIRTRLQIIKKKTLYPFYVRHQQMQEIAGVEISAERQSTNQILAITSGNLVLASISVLYPPLLLLVIPIEIYSAIPLYRLAYQSLFFKKRISSYVIDTLLITGMFLLGYFYLYAITIWFFTVGRKVLLESEHHSKQKLSHLFGVPPRTVYVRTDEGIEIEMPFEQVQRGDVVVVSAGQAICVDGVITDGIASIDQHKLTGEVTTGRKRGRRPGYGIHSCIGRSNWHPDS